MTDDRELEQLQRQWQEQDALQLDVNALRRTAKKGARWEKVLTVLQIALGAIALILCARAYFLIGPDSPLRFALLIPALIVIGGTARSVYLRRRFWAASTLDVTALLKLERYRLEKRIRYWRESAWIVTALWTALALIAIVDPILYPAASDRHEGWFLSLWVNVPIIATTVGLAFAITRRARVRRRLLDELERSSEQ